MRFTEILSELLEGNKIRRESWATDNYIYKTNLGFVKNQNKEKADLNTEDYTANDWEVYKEREYISFTEALPLLLKGKRISKRNWYDDRKYIRYYIKSEHNYPRLYASEARIEGLSIDSLHYDVDYIKGSYLHDDDWFVVED